MSDTPLGQLRPDLVVEHVNQLHAEISRLHGEVEENASLRERLAAAYDALNEKLEHIQRLEAERDQIIEQCAEACDAEAARIGNADRAAVVAGICAAAIRAMKEGK